MPTEMVSRAPSQVMRPKSRRGLKLFGIGAAVVALLVVAVGLYARWSDDQALETWTTAAAIPSVAVFYPSAVTGDRTLVLPGTLEAYYAAPIYARVPGYLKKWYVDIGAKVSAGQVLADIETPDLAQELLQAQADLVSADAARNLAQITARRWQALLAKDAVSQQETDEKTGDLEAKSAEVNAAQAKVNQLEAMSAFKRIIAPFAGVVTARKTDIGDLINAGAGAASTELFEVADVRNLRLYVSVPQTYSAEIRPGDVARLTVPEYPGRTFSAKLVTSSGAVSDATGTMLVELEVDNAAGTLQPGDYAQVDFRLPAKMSADDVIIPASAVLFRAAGTQVGIIDPAGNHALLRSITIGVDSGATVEVVSGLSARDRVIDNPPDSLADRERVQVTATEQPDATATSAPESANTDE